MILASISRTVFNWGHELAVFAIPLANVGKECISMRVKLNDFLGKNIEHNGFTLKPRDAYDSARNIQYLILKKSRWFKGPEPLHYLTLREDYKKYLPDMERYHPGVIDLIVQPEVLRQMGFPVDDKGMVRYSK